MVVARQIKPDWLTGSSALKGPLLMLVLEQPGHGYDVAMRLARRVPAWAVEPKDIYPILKRLMKYGLLTGRHELPKTRDPSEPAREVLVYYPNDRTALAVLEWMASPLEREPDRSPLLALLAVAREEDAPDVLRRVEEFESDCYAKAREVEQEIPVATWVGGLLELGRKTVLGRLEADINSAETAREWIKERIANGQ